MFKKVAGAETLLTFGGKVDMTRITWVVGLLAAAGVDRGQFARAAAVVDLNGGETAGAGSVIYDNIVPNGGLNPNGASPASQYDAAFPFDAGATDDFILPATPLCRWSVTGIRWSGVYWGPDERRTITGFRIMFWPDVTGEPAGAGAVVPNLGDALSVYEIAGLANETPNALGAPITFDYFTELPQPFHAMPGVRYWLQIQPVMASPVQWGWHITQGRQGIGPFQYFDLLSLPLWTSVPDAGDLAFALIGNPYDNACDDGNACTTDTCSGATCVFTPITCDDNSVCTVDSCDPAGGCVFTGISCNDGNECTTDSCDPSGGCTFTTRTCDDGIACTSDTCDPAQGCIFAAINCNDGVACTADSCDETNGQCVNAPSDTVCSDGLFCNGDETCHPTLGCQAGTPPNCNDEVGCTVDVCDEANDRCNHPPDDAACDDGQFCNGKETCDPVNGCQAGTTPNCSDGVGCTVDTCDESNDTCINTPDQGSCDDLQFCNGVERCDSISDCQTGTPPNCDDSVGCTVDACDEAGDVCTHTPNDNACSDNAFCNGGEFCDALQGCQDNTDPCVLPLICDEFNLRCVECLSDTQCNDGLFCNGVETCDPGTGGCIAGTPPNCDDGVSCTVDSCAGATDACVHTTDNGACANGQFCDGEETCDALEGCQPGTPPNCDDDVACTVDACNDAVDSCDHIADNAACNDGLYCNGSELCHTVNGCESGTAPNCNDGVACTVDACNETTDTCDHSADHSVCDDNLFCTGVETCDPKNDCQAGAPPNCDDGVSCTVDSCDEGNDRCGHQPMDTLCDDTQFCNGVETCDALNDCRPGTLPDCDDSVACTDDACDETADTCTHKPTNSRCDNGQFCDGLEFCDPVLGCQDNSDPCNAPLSCDEPDNRCVACLTDGQCDDGLFCNGAETCNAVTGSCVPGTPPGCDDEVGCTVDSCSPVTDACSHSPDHVACSDDQFCNGEEVCDPLNGCQGGTAPDCADQVPCTMDSCSEPMDKCVHEPSDALCSDGSYCNGAEKCDATAGCHVGTSVNCDDGIECTADACNEGTDSCDYSPNDAACDDGLFCTGLETCSPSSGCESGPVPQCDDGAACTVDSCNEGKDQCVNAVLVCDDQNPCTDDACDPGSGCVFSPVVCDDGDACTVDSCVDGMCTSSTPPDFDGDGDIDLDDFTVFSSCLGLSVSGATALPCSCADLNGDGIIDLRDYALFQPSYSGAK